MKQLKIFFLKLYFLLTLIKNIQLDASLPPINEWQFIDQDSGQVFPWYTKPFLDVLKTWDLKNWNVFEWGAGYSTLWFASHCHSVVSIDSSFAWVQSLKSALEKNHVTNVTLKYRPGAPPFLIGEGGEDSPLVNSIDEDNALYDCIIIDCEHHRNTCAIHALKHLKDGGILILDNANQASVRLDSTPTFQLLKDYEHQSYLQPGHPDWRTDYWIIKKTAHKNR